MARAPAVVWPPPPPADETDEEKRVRVAAEEEAKRVSDSIDRLIELDRERRKKLRCVKILLLGQAESGKSTVLKNFQLHFSPKAFEAEAEIWRPIIHLNLVRSINFILNLLSTGLGGDANSSPSSSPKLLTGELRRLSISLAPLREVEASLMGGIPGSTNAYNSARASEVAVVSVNGWKGFLKYRQQTAAGVESGSATRDWEKTNCANRRILAACAEDMIRLWGEDAVHKAMGEHGISLRQQSGFFLDDITRITEEDYVPTPNDILRARVQTLAPQEHQIQLEIPTEHAKLWMIYDVGGSRSQRAAWAQFFDDVNVIIFLAPLSAFNQMLEEDETVNRLTDSMKLWQMICKNKILQGLELILFLNKLDILDSKLKSGVPFRQHFLGYNGPNETKPVAKHLVDTFHAMHQKCSQNVKRKIYPHLTCAIDINATAKIIDRVYHVVIIKFLSEYNIL